MVLRDALPEDQFALDEDFLASIEPRDLVYFLLNVGNGDTQLLVLPEVGGRRPVVVVDVAHGNGKLPRLLAELSVPDPATGDSLLDGAPRISLVVATHPHRDHIGGVSELLERFDGDQVEEYWDPGYYDTGDAYLDILRILEERPQIRRLHPTSGTQRYIGNAKFTVLAPSNTLKNHFDTYGVGPNNASLSLLIEFPVSRASREGDYQRVGRTDRPLMARAQRLLLGADAQTESWAHVLTGFPALDAKASPAFEALRLARGSEPLRANVFKVPHHASKHGLSLELVERVNPDLAVVSCAATATGHAFPHDVALLQLREAIQKRATSGGSHDPDYELGIHVTGDRVANGAGPVALGTIAVVLSPTGRKREVWRFGDAPSQPLTRSRLTSAMRVKG